MTVSRCPTRTTGAGLALHGGKEEVMTDSTWQLPDLLAVITVTLALLASPLLIAVIWFIKEKHGAG